MEKELLQIYRDLLRDFISRQFENSSSVDPIILNKSKFRIKAIFLALIFYKQFNEEASTSSTVGEIVNWLNSYFKGNQLLDFIGNITNDDAKVIESYISVIAVDKHLNVANLYEQLLGVETGNEGASVNIKEAKNYRNKLGSYYTPQELAAQITRKTIDEYFRLNLSVETISSLNFQREKDHIKENIIATILEIKSADFSCGGGNFLLEILNYFSSILLNLKVSGKDYSHHIRRIALNIYGFDVDPLALEVARLTLTIKCRGVLEYEDIATNFKHANFLIHSRASYSDQEKVDIFSSGYIYHNKLALDIETLGRFDIIVGNPPWEKIRFEEKKFYSTYSSIAAKNHFKLIPEKQLAKELNGNSKLKDFVFEFKRQILESKNHIKRNSFFQLSSVGELNTYALFTEAALKLVSDNGVVGLILKSGIVTSQINKKLFQHIVNSSKLVAIYDFINSLKIFDIDSRERFCFLLLGGNIERRFFYSTNLKVPKDIDDTSLGFYLENEMLPILNPISEMLPNFSNAEEAAFILRLSNEFPFFKQEFPDVQFGRIVHLTNHAAFIFKKNIEGTLPVFEGKFFNQFDAKYSGFHGVPEKDRYGGKSSSILIPEDLKANRELVPEARFYISREKWNSLSKNYSSRFMLAWRSLTSATNTRTSVATILPFIPASQSVQFLTCEENTLPFMVGMFNSIVFDYVVKKKLSGIDLTQSIINQMPVPPLKSLDSNINWLGKNASILFHITNIVHHLYRDDLRFDSLFPEFPVYELPCGKRELVMNLDVIFLFLYKISKSELELIKSMFKKQYSTNELTELSNLYVKLLAQNPISSTNTISTFSPIS